MSETNNNMARRALTWDELAIRYEKLKSDNADMLAALKAFPDTNSFGSYEDYVATLYAWYNQVAKPAIAKAKGGAK